MWGFAAYGRVGGGVSNSLHRTPMSIGVSRETQHPNIQIRSYEMSRQKVEFAANVPTQVELDGIGTLQQSQSGNDQYRYFLKGDGIMWVEPAVHEQIRAADANTGDTITITKHQAKARAPLAWEVRIGQAQPAPRGNGYSNTHYDTAPAPRSEEHTSELQ